MWPISISSSRSSHDQFNIFSGTRGTTEHVCRVGIVGKVNSVHPHLGRTKRRLTEMCWSCHYCTASVRQRDHVLEKLIWTGFRVDPPIRWCHASSSQLHSLNFQEKGAPSLDKWTLFSGINTNSLTPTGASHHLTRETYFFAISLAFTPLFSSLLTSLLIVHYNSPQLLSFILSLYYVITDFTIGVHLAGTTPVAPHPHFVVATWCLNIFPSENIKNITVSLKDFWVLALRQSTWYIRWC